MPISPTWNSWAPLIPVHQFMTLRRLFHRGRAVHLPDQPVLEHAKGAKAPVESVELHHAGMDHSVAAAFRQFRRRAPGGVPRSVRIQRAGRAAGLSSCRPTRPRRPSLRATSAIHMSMAGSLTHDVIQGPPAPPIDRGLGRRRRQRRPRRRPARFLYRAFRSAGRQHHGFRGVHQRVRGAPRPLRRLGQHAQAAHLLWVNTVVLLASSVVLDFPAAR